MKIFRTYERELELAQLFIRADDRELTLIAVKWIFGAESVMSLVWIRISREVRWPDHKNYVNYD